MRFGSSGHRSAYSFFGASSSFYSEDNCGKRRYEDGEESGRIDTNLEREEGGTEELTSRFDTRFFERQRPKCR